MSWLQNGRLFKSKFSLIALVAIVAGAFLGISARSQAAQSAMVTSTATVSGQAKLSNDASLPAAPVVKFGASLPSSGAPFVHPGVYVDQTQLDFVKAQLAKGVDPWTGALNNIAVNYATPYGNSAAMPSPVATLNCDTDLKSCQRLVSDSNTAYTQALLYYLSTSPDRATYAQAAIRLLNGWSAKLTSYKGTQAQLELAWSGEQMARAAELIRYTYTPTGSEVPLSVQPLIDMFNKVYVPAFDPTLPAAANSKGNWALSMADATINIGVFTDNHTTFDTGVAMWRGRVPAYIYQTSDGAIPVAPPGGVYDDAVKRQCHWYNGTSSTTTCTLPAGFQFVNGMTEETCRDASHAVAGLASLTYGAETAWLQGVDLYGEQQARITSAWEYNAQFINSYLTTGSWPASPCGGQPSNTDSPDGLGGTGYQESWETAYNAYAGRKAVAMPNTRAMISRLRPTGIGNQYAWETLTSAYYDLPTGCSRPDSRLGTATFTISVPTDGTYRLWTYAKSSGTSGGQYNMQVDYGCPITMGGGSTQSPDQWGWVDYSNGDTSQPVDVSLTAGSHDFTVSGISPNLEVAKLLVSSSLTCVPDSAGDSCVEVDTPPPDVTPPSVPVGITISVGSPLSITVQWQAATDDVGVTNYDLYRNGSLLATTDQNTLSYTDTAVTDASNYNYSVVARDAAGNSSAPSVISAVAIPDMTAPSTPQSLTAVLSGKTAVQLNWTAATDNVGVKSYKIYRNGSQLATSTTPSYLDSATQSTASYSYAVVAVDAANNSSASSTSVAITMPDVTAPSSLAKLSGYAGSSSQTVLNWTAATDNVGVTGYRLSRGSTQIAQITGLTYTDSALTAGTSYAYSVAAVDAAGNTSPVITTSVATLPTYVASGAGWTASYFNNTTLTGAPVLNRLDSTINFDWGTGSPASAVNADNFSVRWTGRLTPKTSGTYTFYTDSDDGVRLWVNGTLLIDHWGTGSTSQSKTMSLTANTGYDVKLEYMEGTRNANAKLSWSGPSVTKAIIPSTVMSSASSGLNAEYYANSNFTSPLALLRNDSTVNFAWGTAAPATGLPTDNFGVRWTGKVIAPSTGTYTFYTDSDEQVRLWINGVLLVDNWTPHGLTTNSATISLTAGSSYTIRMEYADITGTATAKLWWSTTSMTKVIIPASALRDR